MLSESSSAESLLRAAGLTQEAVGEELGITGSAVNHKLAGRRPWLQRELDAVLALLSRKLGRRVTYEEAFAPSELVAHEVTPTVAR